MIYVLLNAVAFKSAYFLSENTENSRLGYNLYKKEL